MVKAIQELKIENDELKVDLLVARKEHSKLKDIDIEMKQVLFELKQSQNKLIVDFGKFILKENKFTEVKKGE